MFLINFTEVSRVIDSMEQYARRMQTVENELLDVIAASKTMTDLDEEIASLNRACSVLEQERRNYRRLTQALEGIATRYFRCEQWLVNEAESTNVQYARETVKVASTAQFQSILKQIL